MSFYGFSFIDVFLGILGFGLSIIFCTTFCRACSRLREEQIQREAWRRSEQEAHARNIFFIPFPRSLSQQDSEDYHGAELPSSPPVYAGPPPSYNELGIKPEDLPPPYTEHNVPVYSVPPPSHTDTTQSEAQSQP